MKRIVFAFFLLLSIITSGQDTTTVYTMVEEMPILPGCDTIGSTEDIKECTNYAIAYLLQKKLVIPSVYNVEGFQDIVYASFIVDESGSIIEPRIERGSKQKSAELDSAALKTLSFLPPMIPGRRLGKSVKVKYVVPIRFQYTKPKQIFYFVEEMPVMVGCEKLESKREREACTNEKIHEFTQAKCDNVKLLNSENSGVTFISFLVSSTGEVTGANVIRSTVSKRLDSIALQFVNSIPKLSPGKQRGEKVNVYYNLPIHFSKLGENVSVYNPDLLSPNTLYDVSNLSGSMQERFREAGNKTQGVDRMPIWEGCHLKGIKETEDDCTEWRMRKYLQKNVIYPENLKKKKPKDFVLIRFVVNEEGKVEFKEVVNKSEYEEMNTAAIDVVKSIPDFRPATKGNEKKSYEFVVSIKFEYKW